MRTCPNCHGSGGYCHVCNSAGIKPLRSEVDGPELAQRIRRVMTGLHFTEVQAAADARVARNTLRAALHGHGLTRQSTIQQLCRWVEQAERRLDD
jgi:hypothetical protein